MHVIVDKKTGSYNIVGLTPERYSQLAAQLMTGACFCKWADYDLLPAHDKSRKIRQFFRDMIKAVREVMDAADTRDEATITITY